MIQTSNVKRSLVASGLFIFKTERHGSFKQEFHCPDKHTEIDYKEKQNNAVQRTVLKIGITF